MESSNPQNSRRNFAPPTFSDRSDNLFPAATFDERWGVIPEPSPQTARSWLDLSQNPAYGNLNPNPTLSLNQQGQERRRLQDIGAVEPQEQASLPVLPMPRAALALLNLENTPYGIFRTAVSSNAPADVWNDVFAGPTLSNNVLPLPPVFTGGSNAPVSDAPFGQGPAALNTNMGPMTSLADLGSGYRNAGFGNFSDTGTGDYGDGGYGGLERYGFGGR